MDAVNGRPRHTIDCKALAPWCAIRQPADAGCLRSVGRSSSSPLEGVVAAPMNVRACTDAPTSAPPPSASLSSLFWCSHRLTTGSDDAQRPSHPEPWRRAPPQPCSLCCWRRCRAWPRRSSVRQGRAGAARAARAAPCVGVRTQNRRYLIPHNPPSGPLPPRICVLLRCSSGSSSSSSCSSPHAADAGAGQSLSAHRGRRQPRRGGRLGGAGGAGGGRARPRALRGAPPGPAGGL